MHRILFMLVPTAFALAAAVGCAERVEDLKNCIDICGNYETCIDSSFVQADCVNRCEARADFDDAFREAADRCEACIDEGACAEDEGECSDDCDVIINGST